MARMTINPETIGIGTERTKRKPGGKRAYLPENEQPSGNCQGCGNEFGICECQIDWENPDHVALFGTLVPYTEGMES